MLSVNEEIKFLDSSAKETNNSGREKGYNIVRDLFRDCPHVGHGGKDNGPLFTPYKLCGEMLAQLPDLNGKLVLVLFNPEFYLTIINKYPAAKILMITGSKEAKDLRFQGMEDILYFDPHDIDALEQYADVLVRWNMKFDVVIGNPPYQANTSGGNGSRDLWDKFVELATELTKNDGYIALIHPAKWRSPEHEIWKLLNTYNLKYLQIHSAKDGKATFNADTRYDWYVLEKSAKPDLTTIIDEVGKKHSLNLKELGFLANYNYENINQILAVGDEPTCNVLYSRSLYGNDKKWMSETQDETNIHPCVYGMYKDKQKFLYSSKNSGHFGVNKVIVSCGGKPYPLIDMDGKYGMCNNCFGLVVDDQVEAQKICDALNSEKFLEIVKATKWTTYQINYKMFKYFKKNFWENL
jgi:hypothetical protein